MRTKFTTTINNLNKKVQKINHHLTVCYDNLETNQWEQWAKDTVQTILKLEAEKHGLLKELDKFEELHLKEAL